MPLTEEQLSLLKSCLLRLWMLTDEYQGNCDGDFIFHLLDCSVDELPKLEELCLQLGISIDKDIEDEDDE